MRETFDLALGGKKVGLVRADSGFYTETILSELDGRKLNYVIAVKAYPNIKHTVYGIKEWVQICPGIEVAEFIHHSHGGAPRRHIAVRKQIRQRPEACGKMLFDDLPQYRFSLYVTSMDLPSDQIWNLYNSRADCENRIKELKADFGLDCFCLHDFWATEASFRFIMAAYNIISLFRHVALNHHKTATLSTLRSYCFA